MSTWKQYWRPWVGIFLGVWLVLLVGGRSRFLRDPGTFWHTVVGEQMLTQHRLIYHDTFSFTFAGRSWSPHQWLGECLMAGLHRLDGLDTLLLVAVTLLAGLYTWISVRFMRQGWHWLGAVVLTALTLAAGSSHFHIRPHLATIVCMGVTAGFLCDFEAGRIGVRRLIWLVPVYVLWTNVHGGMLGGLATIVLATGGWTAWWLLGKETPVHGLWQIVLLAGVIVGCAATALVNPYGLRLPQIWMEIMDSPTLPQIIVEHRHLSLSTLDGVMVLAFAGLYVIALAGTLPKWPRVTWLLPLVWFYLACGRVRHAPLFAVTGAIALADLWPYTVWAAWLARRGSDLYQVPQPERTTSAWRAFLVPVATVILALILQIKQAPVPVLGHGWARLDSAYWPVDLVPELARYENSAPGGTPIFNEYLFGGFLVYHHPGYRVFVDDRCELYGDSWLSDYVRGEVAHTAKYLEQQQARNPFDLALTQTGSGFDVYFRSSPEWVSIRQTDTASFYRRRAATSDAPGLASGSRTKRGG